MKTITIAAIATAIWCGVAIAYINHNTESPESMKAAIQRLNKEKNT